MSEDILKGVIEYARKEIQSRIEQESKKITGEVITEIMGKLKFQTFNNFSKNRTEIIFIFDDGKPRAD